MLTITGTGVSDELMDSIKLKLTITPGLGKPDFEIVISNETEYIIELPKENYKVNIEVGIASINDFSGTVDLYVPEEVLTSPEFIDNIQVTIEPENIGVNDKAMVEIFVSDPDKISETLNLTLPIYGINKSTNLERSKNIPFRVEFEKGSPEGNGDENGDEIPFNQLLSFILMIAVILIMLVFIITRIRIQSAREQKYREQMRQEQEEKRKKFGGRGSGPGTRGSRGSKGSGPRGRI
jgi:hypothetical protein